MHVDYTIYISMHLSINYYCSHANILFHSFFTGSVAMTRLTSSTNYVFSKSCIFVYTWPVFHFSFLLFPLFLPNLSLGVCPSSRCSFPCHNFPVKWSLLNVCLRAIWRQIQLEFRDRDKDKAFPKPLDQVLTSHLLSGPCPPGALLPLPRGLPLP